MTQLWSFFCWSSVAHRHFNFKLPPSNIIANFFHPFHLGIFPTSELQVLHFGYMSPKASMDSSTESAQKNSNVVWSIFNLWEMKRLVGNCCFRSHPLSDNQGSNLPSLLQSAQTLFPGTLMSCSTRFPLASAIIYHKMRNSIDWFTDSCKISKR